jgi:hypothetical protein
MKTRKNPQSTRDLAAGTRPAAPSSESEGPRLHLIGMKVDAELRREIDAYAESHGITRSSAASEYLSIARDALRERDGIPAGRADDLLEAFEGLRAIVDLLGPPTLGTARLLAHWAAHAGGLKVSEDELVAETRAVGADEWEQAVSEAEREVQDIRRESNTKETS